MWCKEHVKILCWLDEHKTKEMWYNDNFPKSISNALLRFILINVLVLSRNLCVERVWIVNLNLRFSNIQSIHKHRKPSTVFKEV